MNQLIAETAEIVWDRHRAIYKHLSSVAPNLPQRLKDRFADVERYSNASLAGFSQQASSGPCDCAAILSNISALHVLILTLQNVLAGTDCQAEPQVCAALSAQISAAYIELIAWHNLAQSCNC